LSASQFKTVRPDVFERSKARAKALPADQKKLGQLFDRICICIFSLRGVSAEQSGARLAGLRWTS
jgi:hypothetical protein